MPRGLLLAVLGLTPVLGGCDKTSDRSASHASIEGSPTRHKSEALPSLAKPQVVTAEALITPDGVIGVSIGAPWKDIAANFNHKGRYAEVAAADGCDVYQRLDGQIDVMVEDGIVTRIETADSRFRTPEGSGVGTTLKELRSAFGARLIKQENPYSFSESDLDAEYIVWSGKDRGINFYLRGGAVSYLIVGGSSIEYVEGCL